MKYFGCPLNRKANSVAIIEVNMYKRMYKLYLYVIIIA